ncbi:hypothetical protein FGO68_gene8889 [Halteria grandinella]|uniref:TLDc domain-containing protein n=1 Tax=Halteria grandinella TaxID=5974 RepID=A0A8J8T2S4_HALGN|nr:hypothetical protein FGO68_gene8889 [Halteria grandinella]
MVNMLKLQHIQLKINALQGKPPDMGILNGYEYTPQGVLWGLLQEAKNLPNNQEIMHELDIIGVTTMMIYERLESQDEKAKQKRKEEKMEKQIDELKAILKKQGEEIALLKASPHEEQKTIQIPPQLTNLFEDSQILNDPAMRLTLAGYFVQMGSLSFQVSLLYRGTRDGFGAEDFHRMCDEKGATITIIETTKDFILGGYASVSWKKSEGAHHQSDSKSWLFQLYHQHPFKSAGQSQIISDRKCGPKFGSDIEVSDNSNTNSESYVHGGKDGYLFGCAQLLRATNFSTLEIEVYQVMHDQ